MSGTDSASSSSGSPVAASPVHPAALYNSGVQPYAELTGRDAYVAAGASLRDLGYGEIDLKWPSSDPLVAAYMTWAIMDNSTPPSYGTLNGVNVTGTWSAYASPSPCWSPTYIYTFIADVSGEVVDGENLLSDFPSAITSGANPWASPQRTPMDEGASLIAIYANGTGGPLREITVYTGALTTEGEELTAKLNYTATNAPYATTTYIIEDGQLPGNEAIWNGSILDSDAFPGNDPKETTTSWEYGNLSDTKTFTVPVELGSVQTEAATEPTDTDCFTWIGQVLSVGVAVTPPPYTVDFAEQGLANGVAWSVTADDVLGSGTVADFTSSISFSAAQNGTYDYAVTPVPGYSVERTGTYTVQGGPVYLRILFHETLYALRFTESGLPATTAWYITLTNASKLSEYLSAYAPDAISYAEPNGTLNFTASEYGLYTPDPATGSVTIAAAGISVAIVFVPPPLFTVTVEELGLRAGTTWGGMIYSNWGTFTNSTTADSFRLALPNTTNSVDTFYAGAQSGYATPPDLYFQVKGAPETVTVDYLIDYTVNLTETGLPPDTEWAGNLSGTSGVLHAYAVGPTVSFTATNGSFEFYVSHLWGYTATPSSGPVVVDGADVTVAIVFTLAPVYSITFTETGLPLGATWSVKLTLPTDQVSIVASTTRTIVFSEPNGSYGYEVTGIAGYAAVPDEGYPYVEGADLAFAIHFHQVFSVTFDETGLPSGTYWYVYLNDTFGYEYGPSIVYEVGNGSLPFTTYQVYSYTPTPSSGTVVVDGANQTVTIVFSSTTAPVFEVAFTESGLPTATSWTVELDYYEESGAGTWLNFSEPNGSYPFVAFVVGDYTPTPYTGTITVDGALVTQAIVYATPVLTYTVTFEESGLASDTDWSVTLGSSGEVSSTLDEIAFTEPAGTYAFGVAAAGYRAAPASGSVTVTDESLVQPIEFTALVPATFSVTFSESGLPSGLTWTMTVNGVEETLTTDGGTDTFSWIGVANGTYDYTITGNSGWHESTLAYSGSVVVDGASVVEPTLVYTAVVFSVTFVESGLPSSSVWWINLTGFEPISAVETSIEISLPNGSVAYTASSDVHPYSAAGGSVKVDGAAVQIDVRFAVPANAPAVGFLGLPGWDGYWVVLGVLLFGSLFALFFVVARRKKKEPEADPAAGGSSAGPPPRPPRRSRPRVRSLPARGRRARRPTRFGRLAHTLSE